jgi:nucleoside-diphosphate-sugar epimerase
MKILITGANGFVGSNLVESFVNRGFKIRCLVHKNVSSWLNHVNAGNMELICGDVSHKDTLTEAVSGVDYIFHAAGIIRATNKKTYYKINQDGTKNLIESVHEHNKTLKMFVHISSQAAMGPCDSYTFKRPEEARSCTPVSDYGKSKLAGEQEIVKYTGKIPYVILRPAAIYGQRDKDIYPLFKIAKQTGFFPVLCGTKPADSYIQLLYIQDLIKMCNLIVDKPNTLKNTVYFLAEEKAYTWQDIADIVATVLNKKIRAATLPYWLIKTVSFVSETTMKLAGKPALLNSDKIKELSQKFWLGDTSAAKHDFGIDFTPFLIGAKDTFLWYKKNKWL